ncbi:Rv1733c family protein [Lentzea sp. NPDC004789]
MTAKPMSRLVHQAFPYRNKLATTGDRIESTVLVLGVAVALLAVPVAGATGSEIFAAKRERVAVEQVSKSRAEAVLVEDAPPTLGSTERGGVVETVAVLARWRLPDGSARQGPVQVHYDAKTGATVPIWVDRSGSVTDPPITTAGAALDAIVLALLLWSAAAGSMALLYLVARFAHKRFRSRQWTNEWKRIAPEWTGR